MDVDVTTNETLDDLLHLTSVAWLANRRARAALEAAEAAAGLPDLVEALAPPEFEIEARIVGHAAFSADRAADKARAAAARAAEALGAATRALATGDAVGFRAAGRTVERGIESTSNALTTTYQQAAVAGRIAAGLAAVFEPDSDDEPLWDAARAALATVPIANVGDEVGITLEPGDRPLVLVAGFLAHAAMHEPSFVIANPKGDPDRFVQTWIEEGHHVESVSDAYLADDDRLSLGDMAVLHELGFEGPDDDHVNWWSEPGASVTTVAATMLATLRSVHRAVDGDDVVFAATHAGNRPSPGQLDADESTIASIAAALAGRLRDGIETVGIDRLWVTVGQEGSQYVAHLGSNRDGQLFTEVTGDFYLDQSEKLDDTQRMRLRALGWDDPIDDDSDDEEIQPRNHTRIWHTPIDADAAAWHTVLTLVEVYGLDVDASWIATVDPV